MTLFRCIGRWLYILRLEVVSVIITAALAALVVMHVTPDFAHAIVMDVAIVCLIVAVTALYVLTSHVHDNDWHPISKDRLLQATTHRKSPSDASKKKSSESPL